jgi:hypothetical protein
MDDRSALDRDDHLTLTHIASPIMPQRLATGSCAWTRWRSEHGRSRMTVNATVAGSVRRHDPPDGHRSGRLRTRQPFGADRETLPASSAPRFSDGLTRGQRADGSGDGRDDGLRNGRGDGLQGGPRRSIGRSP